jgi:DUF971 family protein
MTHPALVVPINEEKMLRILWDDDHLSEYPFPHLRGWCPCASCQGHGGERRFIEVEDPQMVSIATVGNYALNPTWADGHQTGIYTFDYLRRLCACAECRSDKTEK